MPQTDEAPVSRSRPSTKYENLTPFESALIDQFGDRDAAMLDELRGMRRDFGRLFYFGAAAAFVVVLFLIAGLFLIRGVDPGKAADATKTLTPLVSEVPNG